MVKSFPKQFVSLTLAFCVRCRRRGGAGSPARDSGKSIRWRKRQDRRYAPGTFTVRYCGFRAAHQRLPFHPPNAPERSLRSVNDTARFLSPACRFRRARPSPPSPESGLAATRTSSSTRPGRNSWPASSSGIRDWEINYLPRRDPAAPGRLLCVSGPDFLYAHQFFPTPALTSSLARNRSGSLPDVLRFAGPALVPVLENLQKSLNSVLSFSFFITKDMKTDYAT